MIVAVVVRRGGVEPIRDTLSGQLFIGNRISWRQLINEKRYRGLRMNAHSAIRQRSGSTQSGFAEWN